MKNLRLMYIMFIVSWLTMNSVYAQFNTKGIKNANKRIAGYRGSKSKFSKANRYKSI